MQERQIGHRTVSAIGFGEMPLSIEGRPDRTQAINAIHASLDAGATGAILGVACFVPQACCEIYFAWKDHDSKLAEEKQSRILAANNRIVSELGIPGMKYACDFNGFYGGRTRSPLLGLSAEEKSEVESLLVGIRN